MWPILLGIVIWTLIFCIVLVAYAANVGIKNNLRSDWKELIVLSAQDSTGRGRGSVETADDGKNGVITLHAMGYDSTCSKESTTTTLTITAKRTIKSIVFTTTDNVKTDYTGGKIEKNNSVTFQLQSGKGSSSNVTGTITITAINQDVVSVVATFNAPTGGGSYKVDGTEITLTTPMTKPSNETYTLEATPDLNKSLRGWFFNNELYSNDLKISGLSLEETTTVEAIFEDDPLYAVATLSPTDSNGNAVSGSKDNFIITNSSYSRSTEASYYTYTESGKSSAQKLIYKDPMWVKSGQTVALSASGTTSSEDITNSYGIEAVHAYAQVAGSVIQVQALMDISISFDYSMSRTAGADGWLHFYYYISEHENENTSTITSKGIPIISAEDSTKSSVSGSYKISVPKERYLYLYAIEYTHFKNDATGDPQSWNYSFSAVLSNVTVQSVATRYSLKTGFQDNMGPFAGSGKISVNNNAYTFTVTDGEATTEYTNVANTNVVLSCTSVPSNYVLIGWKDVTSGATSYTSTYAFTLDKDYTVYALFVPVMTITMGSGGYADASYTYGGGVPSTGQYVARNADKTKFYSNLKDAFDEQNTDDVVVLLAGDTFLGDMEIPAGKTLVLPYNMDDTGKTDPAIKGYAEGPSAYCKATISSGTWTVNGTLIVSGRQYAGSNGKIGGAMGMLQIDSDAKVTVNGTLYAWGAVFGDGGIDVASGGSVHEAMNVRDMRSVYVLSNIYTSRSDYKVFPFCQYFVKSIEAPTTYGAGSELYGHYAFMIINELSSGSMLLIGPSSSMFILNSGSITKSFDSDSDRLIFSVDSGSNVSTGTFSITISGVPILQEVTITSSEYYVPLCAGYEIDVAGNLSINNNYKFLPGSVIDVKSTGLLTLNRDANVILYRLNDFDLRAYGTGTNATTPMGFSVSGYPKYTTRYYPSIKNEPSHTAESVGSARLNVDGAMNVGGGLYVTNATGDTTDNMLFNSYSKGYNTLTGTGTILITNALNNGTVYEAQSCANSENATFFAIPITPIKGLTEYGATADDGQTGYNSFDQVATWYGYINDSGINVWSTSEPVTLKYDANGGEGTAPDPVRKPKGQTVTVAANTFTRNGYVFANWNTTAAGDGTSYNQDSTITLTENITLYAKWTGTYTVTIAWPEMVYTVTRTENAVYTWNGDAKRYDKEVSYTYSAPTAGQTITVKNASTAGAINAAFSYTKTETWAELTFDQASVTVGKPSDPSIPTTAAVVATLNLVADQSPPANWINGSVGQITVTITAAGTS